MKALQMRSSANAVYIAWHAFSLSVALHVQNLLPLLVVAACGGHAGSIFSQWYHLLFILSPFQSATSVCRMTCCLGMHVCVHEQ